MEAATIERQDPTRGQFEPREIGPEAEMLADTERDVRVGIARDVELERLLENIFVAMDGVLFTPPVGASVLHGITRSSVMTLCEDLKIPVREQLIPREMLYIADEVFFTGTAAEVSPIRSVDRARFAGCSLWASQ